MVIRDPKAWNQVIDVISRLEEFIENINHISGSQVIDFGKLWEACQDDGITVNEFCLAFECMVDEGTVIRDGDDWMTPEVIVTKFNWMETLACH